MKINTYFESIQGEGRFTGHPVLFIRTSGCTRKCPWCDTKYHTEGKQYSVKELISVIEKSKMENVVFTGGEPLLYFKELYKIGKHFLFSFPIPSNKSFHLETNGDLITDKNLLDIRLTFDYICISPKTLTTIKRLLKLKSFNGFRVNQPEQCDIKVVTDLNKVGTNMLKYATILMPLTTYDKEKDLTIRKRVWNYCVKNNIRYGTRLHVDVWKQKRGV
jgi:organic radical activating enzyme